ncbi:MAG: methyltransferase domain-containing protein [Betaproteobacteria bacterium]|nr:methyltransferase domain-containing protein [Betaproteobacteria bacterium]
MSAGATRLTHRDGTAAVRPSSFFDPGLFSFLCSLPQSRGWAWDCGTGRGEVALALTEHFAAVRATDVNSALIGRAIRHERIFYSVEAAGRSAIPSRTVDLVVVAQALHWLELGSFYSDVQRVLNAGGVIAAWCYGRCRVSPEIDRWVGRLYRAVEPHWPRAFDAVAAKYRDLAFPFAEIPAPQFHISAWWSCRDLLGYLGSWAATRRLMELDRRGPARLLARIAQAWGESERRRLVRWPIHLRVGRSAT